MRAAIVTGFGAPEVLEVSEMPDPSTGPGELSIVDVFIRQGLYKDREGLPQPPYVPGLEVAGAVRELGDGVDGFVAGEPVVTVTGPAPKAATRRSVWSTRASSSALTAQALTPPWP
jgi:NADPH:quinone reductase